MNIVAGARVDIRNNENKLAVDLTKDPEVAALLREAGECCLLLYNFSFFFYPFYVYLPLFIFESKTLGSLMLRTMKMLVNRSLIDGFFYYVKCLTW